jgi:hypothetical protein
VELRYLYVGTADTERDVRTWSQLPGARLLWRFRHFGADVAAIDLGTLPRVLLADHRPTGSVLPIYAVDDLASTADRLAAEGWTVVAASLGTPEGPCTLLHDGSGVEIALLRVDRPDVLVAAFADESHIHAVRPADGT